MGEQKRKREKLTPVEQAGLEITRRLANQGQLINGGFAAYLLVEGISPQSTDLLRIRDAYMAGAEHLWSSILATLDPGGKETPSDVRRLDAIQRELDAWRKTKETIIAETMKTQGSA